MELNASNQSFHLPGEVAEFCHSLVICENLRNLRFQLRLVG